MEAVTNTQPLDHFHFSRQGEVIGLASEIAGRYRISSIEPLLASCRAVAAQDEISIAVVGRFKAARAVS